MAEIKPLGFLRALSILNGSFHFTDEAMPGKPAKDAGDGQRQTRNHTKSAAFHLTSCRVLLV
ncbi:hypothetical protein ABFT80_26190 [Mesorhizobium sp. SB112]|uniref:hypothetical protein n=1 Tax=Mesorhizobium sp. SB112 TaxID=3151853 RepID=UPI0032672673